MLAITDWQSVCGCGGEVMAASGSSIGSFPDSISSAESGLLARIASRRSFLPGIMYCLSGTQISVPTEGSHGTS